MKSIEDLSAKENHAHNLCVRLIEQKFNSLGLNTQIHRLSPVTTVEMNYDRLYFPKDNPSRLPRYTRYIDENTLLRTHTSAMIPQILPHITEDDITLLCPGLTYRRDVIDRTHTGEPHQLDVWRISRKVLTVEDLHSLIKAVIEAVLGDVEYRVNDTNHPYTLNGLEVEVRWKGEWLELLECGLAHPLILKDAGLEGYTGLALGLGIDRLVMLKKGIPDIRHFRSHDPRILSQMEDLKPWKEVSNKPPVKRDLSVAVSTSMEEEDICECIRESLGDQAQLLERVELLSSSSFEETPEVARIRLGMREGQKNILIRFYLRDLVRTIPREEANEIMRMLYVSLHENDAGYCI